MSQGAAAAAATAARNVNIQRRGALLRACSGSKMQEEEVWKEGGVGGGGAAAERRFNLPTGFFFYIKALTLCVPLPGSSALLFRSLLPLFSWNGPETGGRTPAVLGERHRSPPRPQDSPTSKNAFELSDISFFAPIAQCFFVC